MPDLVQDTSYVEEPFEGIIDSGARWSIPARKWIEKWPNLKWEMSGG